MNFYIFSVECERDWLPCMLDPQGFMRVFDDMTDIVLDVPNAYHILNKVIECGVKAGFVSASVAEQVPQR